ncbi:phosphotransferase [Xenophilus arseniciresistens]|uniref:Phosphotransferase n=1 Tax=Xenophilus arseniciresistens TaxID=1283306 RepID=A0AAE3T0J5_9BURK|nr:phosphotransferase [Xenophilus arseniciresistens]MDA7418262.1 phosphotransferase [Xenophilus arseniciresistens]
MSEFFTGTTAVREGHRFDEDRLREWFADQVDRSARQRLAVSQFKGGQSNPTFLVESAERRYVLRRKPAGALLPSAHAVEREFRVMRALAGTGVPVPHMHALCEDAAVIGSTFYIMDFVEGRILWDPKLPGLARAERGAICDEMNRVIAALHEVDVAAVRLADYGRSGHYIARQIDRWSRQYRASETERIEAMEQLMAWLAARQPADSATRLVHGDFRLDNLVFDRASPRVIAVLDWELSTLGDPLADFAYHCMAWQLPPPFRGLGELNDAQMRALGLPTEADGLQRYRERRALGQLDPALWHFYAAFNLFRAAAIAQGILGRALAGNASNPHALEAGRQARQLAQLGWDRAQAAR